MKKLSIIIFVFLSFSVFGQDSITTLEDAVSASVDILTQEQPTTEIVFPDQLNVMSSESLFEWWMFIYAFIMPLGLWIVHKYWPSFKKSEIVLKSSSVAILVLMIVVVALKEDLSIVILGQAFLAFFMKFLIYDKLYQPLGLSSPKAPTYLKK